MANTLSEVTPKLLAQGLMALREQAMMPRLVNSSYDNMAAEQGKTIDVPVPSAIAVQSVTPSNTPPSTADIAPTSVGITLDNWYEAPFYLTDSERRQVMDGTIPMQASEAVKSLANQVDVDLLNLYTGIYGYVGSAGDTPFSGEGSDAGDTTAARNLRKVLNNQLAPLADRRAVMDPDAEAAALGIRAFQDMSFSGSAAAILEGQLNRKLGFDWFMDQNIVTHTAGTESGDVSPTVNGSNSTGTTTITIAAGGTSGSVDYKKGDIITIANDTQTYAVAADVSISNGNTGDITISPGLQKATSGGEAVTIKGDHVVNLGFHRDAIGFATRPLESGDDAERLGSLVQSATDPVSGLTLRLEVTREHKRTRFSYDVLYGMALVRPELAARLAG